VRRADRDEGIDLDTIDFSQTSGASEDASSKDKIEALTEMICPRW
jgi:hypothetical protein